MASVKIFGTIDRCYDGFYVFRGFAPASTIVKYSEAVGEYQRTEDKVHVDNIKKFIEDGKSVYTPEVTLAYRTNDWYDKEINPDFSEATGEFEIFRPIDYLTKSLLEKSSRKPVELVDKAGVKFLKYKSSSFITMLLPETLNAKPFKRIDGNHRLMAFEELGHRFKGENIPFSIILLEKSSDEQRAKQSEMTIFHNINAKAKPLTEVEQCRGLLNLFDVDELRDFDEAFAITKEYLNRHEELPLRNMSAFFKEKDDAVLFCVKFLLDRNIEITADKLAEIFSKLNNTYFEDVCKLQKCANRFSIVPYVYYSLSEDKPKVKLDAYTTWFINNKLYKLKNFDPASIIRVFDNIFEIRRKQIFVAMPFMDSLDFVFEAIVSAVAKINNDNEGLDLPAPVRIDKQIVGFSYDIVEEILLKIESAGLLIADLTNQNANVYYEAGFAQGLIRAKLGDSANILYLISNPKKPNEPFAETKFDVEHYKVIPYKNDGNSVIKLAQDLECELKAFYGINGGVNDGNQ
ncbi:MAG: hypothetical protein FWD48_08510 [Oscillospiraceae bacterium]|nr:hypothetical protein [Oscillospiraceae bacterium]